MRYRTLGTAFTLLSISLFPGETVHAQVSQAMTDGSEHTTTITTQAEAKQLAKSVGFDEQIVELVRRALKAQMAISSHEAEPEGEGLDVRLRSRHSEGVLTEAEKKHYNDIVSQFPELKQIVDQETSKYMSWQERDDERTREAMKKLEELRKLHPNEEFRIAKLSARGHEPSEEEANSSPSALITEFVSITDKTWEDDPRMSQLREQLLKRGYVLTDRTRFQEKIRFETRAAAEAFLKNLAIPINESALLEEKARSFEFFYPPNEAEIPSLDAEIQSLIERIKKNPDDINLRDECMQKIQTRQMLQVNVPQASIPPGAIVTRIGEKHWRVDAPASYTVCLHKRIGLLAKVQDKFGMVYQIRTMAANYDISNKMIIDQLKYWDKQYGVKVLDAGADSLEIEFEHLPEDLRRLCMEIYFFCPEGMGLGADDSLDAATMREMANGIRTTRRAGFWWD